MTLKRVCAVEPLRQGLIYKRQMTGAVGRAFFPSVFLQKTQPGTIVESGQIHEICASVLTKKFGEPVSITGALSEVSSHAITNAYAGVLSVALKKKINTKIFKENQILVSVDYGNSKQKMEGPSLGLGAAVAFYSLLVKRPPMNRMLFTGQVTSFGEILKIGGTETKYKVAQENLLTLALPKENYNFQLSLLGETIFSETLDELFTKIF